MKASLLYRTSAVLLLLFAVGHQVGFRQVDPSWNAGIVVQAMQGSRFHVQGFERTYWDFFSGFGFFVTTLLLFSAFFAWRVGSMTTDARRALLPVRWGFGIAYAVIAVITLAYFFAAPDVFTVLIALLLLAAAAKASSERIAS